MKTINKREKVGSVAVQQALRFHFNKKVKEVAAISQVSPKTVWQNTIAMMGGTLSWEERTRQNEAIAIAAKLLVS